MYEEKEHDLIYDWNQVDPFTGKQNEIEINDETLRDGLQSPSVTDPTIEQKIEIIHLMEELGISAANIGLPGSGERAFKDITALSREIVQSKMKLSPNVAARTVRQDITPAIEISQKTGLPLEVCTFIGSSPIRQFVEGWTLDSILRKTEDAVKYVVENNLPCAFVTEDTTRSHPDAVKRLYTAAIECGAKRIIVCDTVGHAVPEGVTSLVTFIKQVVKETGEDVKIDWHGHRDRGLSVPNSVRAIKAGVHRVHATALAMGERVGNTPIEILLMNLKLRGYITNDLSKLYEYCDCVSKSCGVSIPKNYPVIGGDAFKTATGVHAAAVIKALKTGNNELANTIYSGVPAGEFGMKQIIEIGPMSGHSNVKFWLKEHGIDRDEELVLQIFDKAKHSNTILKDAEIFAIVDKYHKHKELV